MTKDDVIYLIAENPEAHGIFDPPTETRRMVYCQVLSVGRTEYWRAKDNGMHPQYIFRLSDAIEYGGEKIAEYNGKRYRIIRAYVQNGESAKYADSNAIELTAEEVTVDA